MADDGVYEVTGKGLEKVFNRIDFNNPDAVLRFARQLKSYGIDAELRSLGVKKVMRLEYSVIYLKWPIKGRKKDDVH